MNPMSSLRRRDDGLIGFEMLPLLVLVFVVGILFVAGTWSVVDAKLATNAGARVAARTFVESSPNTGTGAALERAVHAGRDAIAAHGRDASAANVAAIGEVRLERCARVTFEATHQVRLGAVPLLGGARLITVRSTHSEIVDPLRDGLEGSPGCVG